MKKPNRSKRLIKKAPQNLREMLSVLSGKFNIYGRKDTSYDAARQRGCSVCDHMGFLPDGPCPSCAQAKADALKAEASRLEASIQT